MTNKLPAYFEKYFEQKFTDISDQINELKRHVNDEQEKLKRMLDAHEASIKRLYVILAFIAVGFLLHEAYPGQLFGLLKSLFI